MPQHSNMLGNAWWREEKRNKNLNHKNVQRVLKKICSIKCRVAFLTAATKKKMFRLEKNLIFCVGDKIK